MTKLTYENRIEIYNEIKNGKSPTHLSKQYAIGVGKIRYLVRLIDKHGYNILRSTKNRKFNSYEKNKLLIEFCWEEKLLYTEDFSAMKCCLIVLKNTKKLL